MIFSENLFDAVGSGFELSALWTSLLPIVLGGALKTFGPYVFTEDETRSKTLASIKIQKEKIFHSIHQLLIDGRQALDRADLRGDPNEQPPRPDKISAFFEQVTSSSSQIKRLQHLNKGTKWIYHVVVLTTIIGVAGVILALLLSRTLFTPVRVMGILVVVNSALVIVQICCVVVLRLLKTKIESHETL